MSIGSRIRERRESLGLTQMQLARALGVTKGAIGNYEADANAPKAGVFLRLCAALRCDANYLFQDGLPRREEEAVSPVEWERLIKKYRALDAYGRGTVELVLEREERRCAGLRRRGGSCASGRDASSGETEGALVYFSVPEYLGPVSAGPGEEAGAERPENLRLIREPPRGTSYVARVRGDSMEPTYRDGERVFVDAQAQVRAGEVGVFLMDGRQFIKQLGEGSLLSHNRAYPPLRMQGDVRCQGRVLGVCDESYFE